MSLESIYAELHRNAARTGHDRVATLTGGAIVAVRVRDGVTTVTVSREGKKLGGSELIVFQRAIGVPPDATRYPEAEQGQRDGRWFVAWRWAEQPQEVTDAHTS
jgi:hypothetical protein